MRSTSTPSGIEESGRRRKLESGIVLDVSGDTAWCEGSVPKYLRGVNFPAASASDAAFAGAAWLVEASEFVTFSEPARVNRLDVVRDFEIGAGPIGPPEIIASMNVVPVTLRATKAHYRDSAAGQGTTMMVRTKRNGAGRLYDKGRESGIVAAAGIVRFEAQERVRTLSAGGIRRLSDLASSDSDPIARRRFGWCGFDQPFSTSDALLGAVWRDPDLTEGQKLQLSGFYALHSAGMGVALDRTRHYRMRKLAGRELPPTPITNWFDKS